MEEFDISKVESKMLNYYCQATAESNLDIHKLTASEMLNVPYDKVTDEQRRAAKTLNFRRMYE